MKNTQKRLIKQTTRDLRKNQTACEEIVWEVIRNRKILGKKFLRQYPIIYKWRGKKRFFVADFYCHEYKFVIELDGGIHDDRKDYDDARELIIKSLDIEIIRFRNIEVENNLNGIIEDIKDKISAFTPSLNKRGGRGVSCAPI